jgi:hypothetical protein
VRASELPIDGPVFELTEPGGPPPYDVAITFDRFVAHELDDLVDQLIAELPHRAGVAAVIQESRDRILVASGGLAVDRLRAWLDSWFAEQLGMYDVIEGD